jgi:hypothetical protein
MIAWCHEGPPGARVDEIQVGEEQPESFPGFSIRSTE